jgi:NAD(P)-dependent dehydrogenase (short-subunit alcohol dehydrogenase family)
MSNKDFIGQVAIVTGAGNGIGFEVAKQLAINGASVIINDLDKVLAQEASAKINSLGEGITYPVAGNAGDIKVIQQLVDEAVKRFGKLTIAIANAGITLFGDFFEYEPDALQSVMNVNLQGSFFLAQRAARQIIKQKTGGTRRIKTWLLMA